MIDRTDTIYCMKNIVNGKQYVRQTTRTLDLRWKSHLCAAAWGGFSASPSNTESLPNGYRELYFLLEICGQFVSKRRKEVKY